MNTTDLKRLAVIEARKYYNEKLCSCAEDVPYLLALVHAQSAKLEKFKGLKLLGTDECSNCSGGRVTTYVSRDGLCVCCQNAQEALAELEKEK